MANFVVKTTPQEQQHVLEVLKKLQYQEVSVSVIANAAGMSSSRARYAIMDLLEAKKIERVPTKALNKNYVRYSYKVL